MKRKTGKKTRPESAATGPLRDRRGIAALMGVHDHRIHTLMANTDLKPPFPKPIHVGGPGVLRWSVAEVTEWLATQPRGWSTLGGRRPFMFVGNPANAKKPRKVRRATRAARSSTPAE